MLTSTSAFSSEFVFWFRFICLVVLFLIVVVECEYVHFVFSWKTWPNTLKCHQMIAYLTDPNRNVENKPSTSECNAAIFDAMYECGENVSLVDTLMKIATSRLGVSESEADGLRTHLESDQGSREVIKEIQEGRKKYNIKGVPYFIIGANQGGRYLGRPYGFSGAQDPDTVKDIFVELASLLE